MKSFYILSILLFPLTLAYGQEKLPGRNYFDAKWNLSNKYNYAYYREVYKYSSGNYLVRDFHKDGTKQCETYADYYTFSCGLHPINCGAKEGHVVWYYSNGQCKIKHRFHLGSVTSKEEWDVYGKKTYQLGCISGECYSG